MAQYAGKPRPNGTSHGLRPELVLPASSTTTNPSSATERPHLTVDVPDESASAIATACDGGLPEGFRKPILRVDAVLGEWLNADYFELITPPPGSVMMVASAKAELLRAGDYTHIKAEDSNRPGPSFPGGWGSPIVSEDSVDDSSTSTIAGVASGVLRRDRASSHSVTEKQGNRGVDRRNRLLIDARADGSGYVAPEPAYAVSASDPIPANFVAHARDACVEVDFQWDSMREPQNWGSGGEYGEEWGTMHKRCRNALQKMLLWYRDHETPEHDGKSADGSGECAAAETVLILVSHGAACNAFIGGLTDSPVLLDVGMASLTLAVRKSGRNGPPTSAALGGPRQHYSAARATASGTSLPASEDYEMKLIASTDHLRLGTHPLNSPSSRKSSFSSFTSNCTATSSRRHRHQATRSSGDYGPASSEHPNRTDVNASLGSMRRGSQSTSPLSTRTTRITTQGLAGGGLWSGPPTAYANNADESGGGAVGVDAVAVDLGTAVAGAERDSRQGQADRPGLGVSQQGLWSSADANRPLMEREKGSKRRWTVNDPPPS
jgi:hypothetical protein